MSTDTERLEREIAMEKVALTENLAALEVRTRELTDWRWQVRRRPLASVGVALAGGVVLAMLTKRRARRSGAGDDRTSGPSILDNPLVERLVGALAVVAAEKAVEVLSDMLPGLPAAMAKDEPIAAAP